MVEPISLLEGFVKHHGSDHYKELFTSGKVKPGDTIRLIFPGEENPDKIRISTYTVKDDTYIRLRGTSFKAETTLRGEWYHKLGVAD